MLGHLRANLWLLGLTVLVCCVLYPLTLWGIAQIPFFRDRAEGSLVFDKNPHDKKVTQGSRLIAQAFDKPEFFQSRPSAVSYNAAASGASNLGANNSKLRDRVARTLGPIVKYASGDKKGQLVAPDIMAWARANKPGLKEEGDIAADFFDSWRQAHPNVELEPVPADLVTTSGSGLDPHITLANALYQAPRVANARVKLLAKEHNIPEEDPRIKAAADLIHKDLVKLVNERAESQLFGLVGVPLVNVLEVNLALTARKERLGKEVK